MRSTFAFFILFSTLVVVFQNCGQLNSEKGSEQPSAFYSNGNGNSYEGKLVIEAPSTMAPGSSERVILKGGLPPYTLTADIDDLAIVPLSDNEFRIDLSENSNSTYFQLVATDATGEVIYARVSILGINNWYFENPTVIAPLANGSVALVHKSGSELVVLSREGKYLLTRNLFSENAPIGKITSMFSRMDQNRLFMADSVNKELQVLDLNQGRVEKLPLPLGECKEIDRLIEYSISKIALLCKSAEFVKVFDLNSSEMLEIHPSDDSLGLITDIQKTERGLWLTTSRGVLYEVDASGKTLRTVRVQDISQSTIERMQYTRSLFLSDGSFLYYQSMPRHLVHYNSKGERIHSYGGRGGKLGQVSSIHDFVISSDNQVVVSDPGYDRLSFYEIGKRYSHIFGSTSAEPMAFHKPGPMAFDSRNRLLVVDAGNARIKTYDRGQLVENLSASDYQGSNWQNAFGLSMTNLDQLLVTNSVNSNIQKIDPSGRLVKLYGGKVGDQVGEFKSPHAAVLLADDRLIVADQANNRLQIIKNGKVIKVVRETEYGKPEHIKHPTDVEVDHQNGEIYVLDRGLNKIQVYDLSLNFKRAFPSGRESAHVKQPSDMAMGPQGQLFIIDPANNRFVILDRNGNSIDEVGPKLSGSLKFNAPTSIAVSNDGRVAVSDTGNNRVLIFKLSEILKSMD